MEKGLYRSRRDRVFSGVCGGLGESLGVDPLIIRILFIITTIFLGGFPLIVYLVLMITLPDDPRSSADLSPEEVKEQMERKKQSTRAVFSITFAIILVVVGVFFLIPNLYANLGDIFRLIIAAVFLLAAIALFYLMIRNKDYAVGIAGAGFISLTISIFFILNSLHLLQTGVFVEYSKLMFPALFIIVGVSIIINYSRKEEPKKTLQLIGTGISAGVFILIAILAGVRGNYSPFEKMFGHWTKCRPWPFVFIEGEGVSSFNETLPVPQGVKYADYKIVHNMGRMDVTVGDSLLAYSGKGVVPSLSTNRDGEQIKVSMENRASSSSVQLNPDLSANLTFEMNAGDLQADLPSLKADKLSIEVNAGSFHSEFASAKEIRLELNAGDARLKINEFAETMKVELNAGNITLDLPSEPTVRIKIKRSLGSYQLPKGFERQGDEYVRKGTSDKEIRIQAEINLGNLSVNID